MKIRKFIPVMLTPFNENGAIDYNCLTKLTQYYLTSGVSGLFVNCLSSEMYDLDIEERLKITQHVVDVTGGEVPVISTGTFGGSISHQADFIKRLQDTDIDAAIIITSMLAAKEASDEILDKNLFQLLSQTEDVRLGFYECPEPYKRILSAKQLAKFAATGRAVYYKDTSLDEQNVKSKLKATKGYAIDIYDAYMVNAVKSLKAGCAGLSCIQGNYFPELVIWLCRNYDRPELSQQVIRVQRFFVENMDVMHDVYPLSAKYILQKRGFSIRQSTRRNVGSLTADKCQKLDKLLDEFNLLKKDIEL